MFPLPTTTKPCLSHGQIVSHWVLPACMACHCCYQNVNSCSKVRQTEFCHQKKTEKSPFFHWIIPDQTECMWSVIDKNLAFGFVCSDRWLSVTNCSVTLNYASSGRGPLTRWTSTTRLRLTWERRLKNWMTSVQVCSLLLFLSCFVISNNLGKNPWPRTPVCLHPNSSKNLYIFDQGTWYSNNMSIYDCT